MKGTPGEIDRETSQTAKDQNGLEFCSVEFNEPTKKEGIVRYRMVMNTPQQNGIA